jgi:hypothetical protein
MEYPYLAIVDADQIHDYVFSPHELRYIRGGSALQRNLFTTDLAGLVATHRGKTLSANGGVLLAKFPEPPTAFRAEAESTFLDKTAIATVTTAEAPYDSKDFPNSWANLHHRLARAKQQRQTPHFHPTSPYYLTCEACGRAPACHSHSWAGGTHRLICQACQLRVQAGTRDWPINGYTPPDSFKAIGEASRPNNYLAVIYIDLDRLGRYIRDNSTEECIYSKLSKEIDDAVTQSVYHACAAVIHDEGLVEPLLLGGDDAVIAISASGLHTFVAAFDAHFRTCPFSAQPAPTYSIGVAIANSHFPVFEFRRVAEDLVRSAKQLPGSPDPKPHSIDFEIITSPMVGRCIEDREAARTRSDQLHRTAKPYAIQEFLKLGQSIHDLKLAAAPSSKLKSLYSLSYESKSQAEIEYLTLLTRLEQRHADTLRDAIGPSLWTARLDLAQHTKAADLAELYDFIH